MKTVTCTLILALSLFTFYGYSEDKSASKELAEIKKAIEKSPEKPMLHYQMAKLLFKTGHPEEGYKYAHKAMEVFKKANDKLAWMLIDKIDLADKRIDVHFNMGTNERKIPEIGIRKPLSFRVWSKGKDPKLLDVIDFEISYFDSKPNTGAIGRTLQNGTHQNLGLLPAEAKYMEIIKKVTNIINK